MQSGEPACTSADLDIEQLMSRYQQADAGAAAALVAKLSLQLHRFLAGQMGSVVEAEDMLQDVWLRIHRMRHSYLPGEPLLPWVYAIARRARTDSYRGRRRITSRPRTVDVAPEPTPGKTEQETNPCALEDLVAALPDIQGEVLTILKESDLSLEEVARATSSSVGAVKQKVHRAYQGLRNLLDQSQFTQPAHKGVAK
jgi:RNA polymerase sigma-70 factor, ECF subfamily